MEKYLKAIWWNIDRASAFWFNGFYKPDKFPRKRLESSDRIVVPGLGYCAFAVYLDTDIAKDHNHYGLNNIHDIWPNFRVYAHGGVTSTL
jgi:hypothetical protein